MTAFLEPFLTSEEDALAPHNCSSALIIIDLPAPVSPVKAVMPSSKSTVV